jgi:uncharacterized protein (TIGR02271 family)
MISWGTHDGRKQQNRTIKPDISMKDIFDYEVYDRNEHKVGSVENIWANDENEIGFIGVSTGWLGLGRNHLIPADEATIDEKSHVIRVPYDEETIKSSPSAESEGDLGEVLERDVYSHFHISPKGRYGYQEPGYPEASTATAETSQATDRTDRDFTSWDRVEIPLAEENLHIEKRQQRAGEVRLRKIVRTETVNQPVELRREDVVVERVQGSHHTPGDEAFDEEVITIPINEEKAVVQKSVHSAGAVQAHKTYETEQENVSETVRKEDVEVDRTDRT